MSEASLELNERRPTLIERVKEIMNAVGQAMMLASERDIGITPEIVAELQRNRTEDHETPADQVDDERAWGRLMGH